jgi:hypothetical protein
MTLLLMMMLACGGDEAAEVQSPTADTISPVAPTKALSRAHPAQVADEAGWGAVFWRAGQAWKVGGGDVLVAPTESRSSTSSGEPNICDGVTVKGAPARAALALPAGAPAPKIIKTPAIRAHLVERSAWRLDEILPPRDKYSPAVSSNAPSEQRGVSIGSVSKTRRHGAPPILLATGVRDCTAAIAVLDAKAERTLAYDRIAGTCDKLRVIPATQLDSGREREFAVFNDTDVVLYRLHEEGSTVKLSRLGQWRCAQSEGGG